MGGRQSQMTQEFAFYSKGDGSPLELVHVLHQSLCCLRTGWSKSERGSRDSDGEARGLLWHPAVLLELERTYI